MKIRKVQKSDIDQWAAMRCKLWPGSKEKNIEEIGEYFSGLSIDIVHVLVLADSDETACGFIEINLRNFAEGSRLPQIPYIEAWYVAEEHREKGWGKKLLHAAEDWAVAQGFDEIASDTPIDNALSINIHQKLGFEEMDRVVCYLKKLKQPG